MEMTAKVTPTQSVTLHVTADSFDCFKSEMQSVSEVEAQVSGVLNVTFRRLTFLLSVFFKASQQHTHKDDLWVEYLFEQYKRY